MPKDEQQQITESSDTIDRIASGLVESAKHAPWLSAALDGLVDGIVMADAQGDFVYFNQAASDILGFGPTPTIPAQWSRQYGVYEADGTTPVAVENLPLVCALRGETVRERVLYIRNEKQPDGIWIHCAAMPLGEAGHPIEGAMAILHPITDLHQRMNRLVMVEARLLAVLHASHEAILLGDPDGQLENWNDDAEQLFGLTPSQISECRIADLLDVPIIDEAISHQLTAIRMLAIHADGSRFPVDVTVTMSRTPQGLLSTYVIRVPKS